MPASSESGTAGQMHVDNFAERILANPGKTAAALIRTESQRYRWRVEIDKPVVEHRFRADSNADRTGVGP